MVQTFNQDIGNWNTSSVTDISYLLPEQTLSIKTLVIGIFECGSMKGTFRFRIHSIFNGILPL